MDAKVLRWARVIQLLIPVLDTLRNSQHGHAPYGDGYAHGNGGGCETYKGLLHKKGGGTGNGENFRSVAGNGSSLVQRDGNGVVNRT
jgi:hypothetical protein